MNGSNGLVSNRFSNEQWQVKGGLLLPRNFEEVPPNDSEPQDEAELGEEGNDEPKPTNSHVSEEVGEEAPTAPPVTTPVSRSQTAPVARENPHPSLSPVAPAAPPPKRAEVKSEELPPKAWIILASILVGGFLLIVWANRPKVKESGKLPNTVTNPAAISQQPMSSAQSPPAIDINAYEQARNDMFRKALSKARSAWGSCGQVCKARRDYYLSKAEEILKQTSTPIEVTLLRELNRQIKEQSKVLPYYAELGGYSTEQLDQIGVARSLGGDALALLEALDWEWTRQQQAATGQPLPARTTTTVDLAPLSLDMANLWQLAALARNGKPQQTLRDSVVFQEKEPPPVKATKPKAKSEKSEDKSDKDSEGIGLPK